MSVDKQHRDAKKRVKDTKNNKDGMRREGSVYILQLCSFLKEK